MGRYPQLQDQTRILTKEITEEEIDSEISRLKTNKAPGSDGYSSEFYKLLRKPLIPLLKNMFSWVLKEGETPRREAFIVVIPKGGKDQLDCANYRPVTILNLNGQLNQISDTRAALLSSYEAC
uniref:Reverse transcriptase domain-containing protein n=1 Tax=Poecilia latipinna TaxID=48699 RepID=A0A3B3UWC4_9TELE